MSSCFQAVRQFHPVRRRTQWVALCAVVGAVLCLPSAPRAEPSAVAGKAVTAVEQVRANQKLIGELAGMGAVDREMRNRFLALRRDASDTERSELDTVWRDKYAPIDREHAARLATLVANRSWFRRSEVGPIAEQAAATIVNHSNDLAFQKLMLSKMEPLVGSETPGGYANLYDRVAVQEGRPQRYGTQMAECVEGRSMPPANLEQPEKLDERRAAVGLESMTAYLAALDKTYGRCSSAGK
jgi:hypothetical protein